MVEQSQEQRLLAIIVEDDRKLADIFARALQEAGFRTETIEDGDIALARLSAKRPFLVILDLHLPYIAGDDILHEIRSDPKMENTKVIVASADPSLAATLTHKADLVLYKPVSYRQLRDLAKNFHPGIG